MKILIINAGSSSLKYQLIDTADESVKAKGLCERIGIDGSMLTHKVPGKEDYAVEAPMPTHKEAIKLVLDARCRPRCCCQRRRDFGSRPSRTPWRSQVHRVHTGRREGKGSYQRVLPARTAS